MTFPTEENLKAQISALRTELEQAKRNVQEARSLAAEIGDENKQLRQERNQLYKDVEAAQHATDMVRVSEIATKQECDRLREVLDPFAEFAHEYIDKSRGTPKSGPIYSVDFTGKGTKSITIEMLKASISALAPHADQTRPEWVCSECGYHGDGFKTTKIGGPSDTPDYDVECPECGSTEVCESPYELIAELIPAIDTLRAESESEKSAPHADHVPDAGQTVHTMGEWHQEDHLGLMEGMDDGHGNIATAADEREDDAGQMVRCEAWDNCPCSDPDCASRLPHFREPVCDRERLCGHKCISVPQPDPLAEARRLLEELEWSHRRSEGCSDPEECCPVCGEFKKFGRRMGGKQAMNRTPEEWKDLRAHRNFWNAGRTDILRRLDAAIADLLELSHEVGLLQEERKALTALNETNAEEARLYREAWEAEEALLRAMLGGNGDPDGKKLAASQAADAAVRKHRGEG